jgi:hypothetical protein
MTPDLAMTEAGEGIMVEDPGDHISDFPDWSEGLSDVPLPWYQIDTLLDCAIPEIGSMTPTQVRPLDLRLDSRCCANITLTASFFDALEQAVIAGPGQDETNAEIAGDKDTLSDAELISQLSRLNDRNVPQKTERRSRTMSPASTASTVS